MNKVLINIWAKASKNGEARWHPHILHMLDVAASADTILAREPESTRKRMATILGLDWEDARAWILLLIACHDLGKACPGFPFKWEGALELLALTKLWLSGSPNRGINHAFVSQIVLTKLLRERGWPMELAELVADAVGCHHGERASIESGAVQAGGLSKNKIKSIVDAIKARWNNAPQIIVVDNMNDPAIPEAVRQENERQLLQGATGQPEGFIAGGKVYVVASQTGSVGDVVRVLLHESLGHFGLRGLYGEGLTKILKQIAALRREDVEAMAKRYGLNMDVEKDRLIAAEEVLAHPAQTNPQSGFVQRAIAAIRTWLRDHIPGFENMILSDGEIINNYLIPAREFVQRGRVAAQGGLAGVFSRASDIHAINATVNRQIEQWAKRKLSRETVLQIGRPSEILRLFNVPDLPIRLTQFTLSKARRKHGLTEADLKDMALNVQTPIAVFKSTHGEKAHRPCH